MCMVFFSNCKNCMSFIGSTNHKRISLFNMWFGGFTGIISVLLSVIIRIELSFPGHQILFGQFHFYNVIVTMHGILMLFFVVIPIAVGGFGNFFVPILIGAPDMAFPRLNNLSFWLLPPSIILLMLSCFADCGAGTGWTMYPPLSSEQYHPGVAVDLIILSLYLVIASTILLSINLICTIFFFRVEAMFMKDLPIFVWSILITSFLLLLSMPILASALTLLFFDRNFNTTFFDPVGGGDIVLYQHLFWFFGHPEVYILILPSFGIISQVISTFSQKRLFGYTQIVGAMIVIGIFGFFVWGHHMYTSGIDSNSRAYFTTASMIIAIPSGIIVFSLFATLWNGAIVWRVPMLYAVSAVLLFIVGGLSGIVLSNAGIDIALHDTYFVVGHLHYVLAGSSMFGILSGFYYWFPKIIGYSYNECYGTVQFWLMFIGVNLTFFPMHLLGLSGMPRRIPDYPVIYQVLNTICSVGSMVSFFGILFFLFIVYSAIETKQRSNRNPWVFLPDNISLLNRCIERSMLLKSVHLWPGVFFVCIDRISIKTQTLEWTINMPLNSNTFRIPPFFITTGLHYMNYRPGSNLLRSFTDFATTEYMVSYFNKYDPVPVYCALNVRKSHFLMTQPARRSTPQTRLALNWRHLERIAKWRLGFGLNILLEFTLSAYVLIFINYISSSLFVCIFFYVLYMFSFFLFFPPKSYPGVASSTILCRLFFFLKLFSSNKNKSIDWLFLIIMDFLLVSWIFLFFLYSTNLIKCCFFFICYITYRKSDGIKRPTTLFMESFLRLTVFVFQLPRLWYTCESWVLFAIADIFCVAFICQLVCFVMFICGFNPASYYIVYLSIVSLLFCLTYYDNQSAREPSSFVLRRFLEAIGLKWYLLPTISSTGLSWYMACDKTNPTYTWDIGKHKTWVYIVRNYRIEGKRLSKK